MKDDRRNDRLTLRPTPWQLPLFPKLKILKYHPHTESTTNTYNPVIHILPVQQSSVRDSGIIASSDTSSNCSSLQQPLSPWERLVR